MALYSDVLLTVDFDRTLTAPDSTIPQRNLDAIRHFLDNGGAFTVNTGRSLPMAEIFRDQVPLSAPLLLYNGSAAYDMARGEYCFVHTIDLDQQQVVQTCHALFPDLETEVQGLCAHYCFRENPAWEKFTRHQHCACAFANPGDDLGPFLKFTLYGQIRDVTVAHLYQGSEAEIRRMDEAEETLRKIFADTCEVFRAAPRIIDVHAKGVSKARAARQLQAQLGRKILVCAGDGPNDLPMMHDADYAFAPRDAIIAEQFPTVCPCAEGAVADVILEKIPEILKNDP